MFYDFAIVVSAGTTEADPKIETLGLTKGIVHTVLVEFPRGCRGYVSLRLFYHEDQVWPTNRQGSFNPDGFTVPIHEHLKLDTAPFELKAKAWSPDATYDHTLTVWIGILPEEVLAPLKGLPAALQKLFTAVAVRR